jgi:predicted nucleic acid-binding Zn ribbon protein
MIDEQFEEEIQQDLEKMAYERKRLSRKRLTIFFFVIDAALFIYVLIEIFQIVGTLG